MPIQPVGTDQPYLVLIALAHDQELETGTTVADVAAEVRASLDHANDLWTEVSYGKASFRFDIHPDIVRADADFAEYYRIASVTSIAGDPAAVPVTWAGGETLSITWQSDPPVEVVFAAGTQQGFEVRNTINTAIAAAYGSDLPFVATLDVNIQSVRVGPQFTLSIAETDGARALGLAPSQSTPRPGTFTFTDHDRFVRELVVTWQGLAPANDPGAYQGLMIVAASGEVRAFADSVVLDRGRGQPGLWLSLIVIPRAETRDAFAHEIGHNLGLPDLYDESSDTIVQPGIEVGYWDIMDGVGPTHTTAWCKHYATAVPPGAGNGWMTDVELFERPAAGESTSVDYLVFPSETPFPATNPFASAFPSALPCHAIRIPIGQGRAVYVENRQEGPFDDPVLGSAAFDTALPISPGGVICTDTVDTLSELIVRPVFRRNVMLVGDDPLPLQSAGQERVVADFSADRRVTVRIKDVLGSVARTYLVEVTWGGPGDDRECRIDPWNPTPWESPDIWVDTNVDNEWDEYRQSDPDANPDVPGNPVGNGDRLRVGWPARVYARFHNDGNLPANDVWVHFEVVVPAGLGPVQGWALGTDVIDIPAGGSAIARVDWTPRHAGEGHVCVVARAHTRTDDANPYNNEAQENLTEWWMEGDSPYAPVRIPYRLANPIAGRAEIRLRAKDLPPGWAAGFSQERYSLPMGDTAAGEALIGADVVEVPFEDVLHGRGQQAPVISIEAEVLYGCRWLPFGGISAVIHPVRRTHMTIERPPGRSTVDLIGRVTTGEGPMVGGQVTVRTTYRGTPLWMTRLRTGNDGGFALTVPRPRHLPRGGIAQVEAHLSPQLGYGPCELGPIHVAFDPTIPRVNLPTRTVTRVVLDPRYERVVSALETRLGTTLTRR